jgi:hypothetical protein
VLLDRDCHGRIGDFGIARSLEDRGGITFTHVHETLTGYAVCSPAPGLRDLFSMFQG